MKKNLNLVTIIAIIGLAVFSGCKKSSDNPTPPPGFMTASINGVPYNTTECRFWYAGISLNIISGDSSTIQISLSVPIYTNNLGSLIDTGTFLIGGYGANAYISGDTSGGPAQSGTIVITSCSSSSISGTFSFFCTDGTKVTNVTNGSFTATN